MSVLLTVLICEPPYRSLLSIVSFRVSRAHFRCHAWTLRVKSGETEENIELRAPLQEM